MEIEPIGKVLTDFSEKFGIPRQSGRIEEIEGRIELNVPYCSYDYIKGIEQYSHLWIIWGFSENEQKKKHATVRPPRLGGNARIGVFASRSPFRPNNLALSCVKLKDVIENNGRYELIIGGADMLDGSPVYDIKPYINYTDCVPEAKSGFAEENKDYSLKVCGKIELAEILPEKKRTALMKILADDPRPAYQDDESRIYGFKYAGFEVKFRVCKDELEIIDIIKIS